MANSDTLNLQYLSSIHEQERFYAPDIRLLIKNRYSQALTMSTLRIEYIYKSSNFSQVNS